MRVVQLIHTRMNFQWNTLKHALPCFTWCLLASCVVIFPIRCDLSWFHLSRFSANNLSGGNSRQRKSLKSKRIGKITTQEARRYQTKQGKAYWKFMRVFIFSNLLPEFPYKSFNEDPGGYSQKNWVGVCGPLPKTLTLFMTKICDFLYPIYDLTKNLIPYLWPDP